MIYCSILIVSLLAEVSLARVPIIQKENGIPGRFIVKLKEGKNIDDITAKLEMTFLPLKEDYKVLYQFDAVLNGFALTLSERATEMLATFDEVEYIEQDSLVYISQSAPTWNIDRLDQLGLPVDGSYTPIGTGIGVNVYVVDTGVYADHSDISGRASNFYDKDGGDGSDSNGHGTFCAAIAGGTSYGVAPDVEIFSVKVLNKDGRGYASDVINGLDKIRDGFTPPAVVTMSLSGSPSQSLDDSVNNLIDAGITVAVAAGNNGDYSCSYSPGRVANAITTGATTKTDDLAYFSNYGDCVDIFAPGQEVVSAWVGSNTASTTLSGTSVAAPHVAGAAAIVLGLDNSLTPDEVKANLTTRAINNAIANPGIGSPNLLLYVGDSEGPNTPPLELVCQQFITTNSTVFTSPNYPNHYSNNVDCEWTFMAPNDHYVTVEFDDFKLEPGEECEYDYVTFFDGPDTLSTSLGTYCGTAIPDPISSTGADLVVEFKTDGVFVDVGFSATASFYAIPEPVFEGVCSCSDTCLSSAGNIFQSPNYPNEYPPNADCTYLFTAPVGNAVKVSFIDLNIEGRFLGGCVFDGITQYLSHGTYENLVLWTPLCSRRPSTDLPRNSKSHPSFRTEITQHATGDGITSKLFTSANKECVTNFIGTFIIQFFEGTTTADPEITEICGDTSDPVTSLGRNLLARFYSDTSAEFRGFQAMFEYVEAVCDKRFEDSSGTVTSPNYPNSYPNSLTDCTTYLVAPAGQRIEMTFTDFEVEDQSQCSFDSVSIYDGPDSSATLIGVYCGETLDPLPGPFTSSGNSLTVVFNTDSSVAFSGYSFDYIHI